MSRRDSETTITAPGEPSLPEAVFAGRADNPSTGPRTEDGKAISSRNAVKHNLCSKRLTGADLEQLNAIRARLEDEWEPATETERMLLDQMALSQCRADRALSLELAAFDDAHIEPPFSRSRSATAPPPSAASIKGWPSCSAFAKPCAKTPFARKKKKQRSRKPPSTANWNASASLPLPEPPSSFQQDPPRSFPQPNPEALKAFLDSQIRDLETASACHGQLGGIRRSATAHSVLRMAASSS
jgi:hypothetical protein